VNGLNYYGTGSNLDSEAYSIVVSAHNRPNKKIRIYRAYPKSAPVGINPRDWVTTVRRYAVDHCKASIKEPCRVSTKLVYARDLFTNGDSWLEYGYDPQPAAPLTQEEKDRKAMKVRITRQDRLDRVRRGEKIVMVNKYPSDKWYGKEEEFLKTDGSLV
jgi:hypothetical protein